jgi:hypothetical protein
VRKSWRYHYAIEGRRIYVIEDLLEWAKWFETADRGIDATHFFGFTVSTIFLALDHNFCDCGPPVLFETMVFYPDGHGREQWRYRTYDGAVWGHRIAVYKTAFAYLPRWLWNKLWRRDEEE